MTKVVFTLTASPTFRDIHGRFVKASDELTAIKRQELKPEAERLRNLAREEAPRKTGKFAKSIVYRTYSSGNEVGFTIQSAKPLGDWILEGTRPHRIVARRANVLAFYWKNGPRGAGMYYFRSVNHPGTKPNRFMGRAYRRWLPGARACLTRISTRYVKIIQGASK